MKGGHMVKSKKSTKSLHPNVHCRAVNKPRVHFTSVQDQLTQNDVLLVLCFGNG